MRMKELDLIENQDIREKMIGNVSVLEKVKDLLLLGDSEFATTQQVADYYEVDISVIQKLVSRNKQELESNGLKLNSKNDIKNLIGQDVKLEITIPNRGMKLFPKRAILNIGMLLRDSKVAKEVRTRLLDIEYESNKAVQENGQTIKDNIINEIDEEKSLMLERISAEMDGDFDKVCVINAKLFALKNKRIKDLEDNIENITTHSLTLTDSRDVINKLVRMIAIKEYSGMFGKAFGELYKTVNYKLGINIKARDKKKSESYLHTLNEDECFKVEEMVRTWALDKGIDINKELGLKTA